MAIVIRNKHCTFAYKCDLKWEGLRETKKSNVRYCDKCKKLVYWCDSEAELFQSISLNRWVAFEAADAVNNMRGQSLMGSVRFANEDPNEVPF